MIDALIQGRLHGAPQQRTGSSGKPFTTAKVRAPAGNGDSFFVNVIVFSTTAQTALLALGDGDSVALSGEMTPKVWQPKDGGEPRPALDLLAHAVLTPYHVKRRRDAVAPAKAERATDESWHAGAPESLDF
ncbi:MAG TPA: single-stranded DNA-binding protein [Ottowia sp.]|nr:single-stranded DNA-binding protein [Ottowia sp.]